MRGASGPVYWTLQLLRQHQVYRLHSCVASLGIFKHSERANDGDAREVRESPSDFDVQTPSSWHPTFYLQFFASIPNYGALARTYKIVQHQRTIVRTIVSWEQVGRCKMSIQKGITVIGPSGGPPRVASSQPSWVNTPKQFRTADRYYTYISLQIPQHDAEYVL
jgi:hypothetical protein